MVNNLTKLVSPYYMQQYTELEPLPPPKNVFQDRIRLFKTHQDAYAAVFKYEAEERMLRIRERQEISYEAVHFDEVCLEMNDEPAFFMVDYFLRPVAGPRLELHLEGSIGIHRAQQQMGRIGRYIEARNLTNEYPYISATTFTPLARIASTVTKLPPAIAIFMPDCEDEETDAYMECVYDSHNNFLRQNGRPELPLQDFQVDALSMSTRAFVRVWSGQAQDN
jgi:hypothetical protein